MFCFAPKGHRLSRLYMLPQYQTIKLLSGTELRAYHTASLGVPFVTGYHVCLVIGFKCAIQSKRKCGAKQPTLRLVWSVCECDVSVLLEPT